MSARAGRRPSRRALYGWVRLAGAITAAFALAALFAIGPTAKAQAAASDSYNQMTGSGLTASALTVNWTSGLLNAENQPITTAGTELSPNSDRAAANPTSPLSFMYADFKKIQVMVNQTENISHQGITIKWSGAQPQSEFMQVMECWGDSGTGPSPEDCQFGSQGMLPLGSGDPLIGNRTGFLCKAGSVPSTTNPPLGVQDGGDPGLACDSYEPTSETIPHCVPNGQVGDRCADGVYEIPFVGVDDPTNPIYDQSNLLADFSEFNSNEVQDDLTGPQGTGQLQFETLTSVEAPHLGCGALESDGKPRDCWLVIVPRGNYEPNGWKLNGTGYPDGLLETSPLSAANWAQRIQIHLGYAPLGTACPPTVLPDQAVGTQLITRAIGSWELALNIAAKCNTVYAFTATTEGEATQAMRSVGPNSGNVAFTTIPIGSESTRYTSGKPPSMPNVLYAPVAVTAMDLGFNINEESGYVVTPVKLTPALLARALTQTYKTDLPDFVANNATYTGPAWAEGNPSNITNDPAWTALNPASEITPYNIASYPLAPLLPEDHSQLNQQVWQWVQSDPATSAWLDGSKSTVTGDPDYIALSPQLGKSPAPDSFPRAYKGAFDRGQCLPPNCSEPKEEKLVTTDMLPYVPDVSTGAAWVLAGNDSALTNVWNVLATAPDGSLGWWSKVGVMPPGTTFMWALSDMPDLASYGLIAADLCNTSGAASSCVGPTLDSVGKTLNAATADSDGLLVINPAKVPAGGYPLVQVVYAAVPTNQSKQSLSDYAALIKYAANQGQATGTNPGDLPPGYLPLTAKLKAQANAVVAKLDKIANPTGSGSPTPTPTRSATPTHSATPTSSPTPTVTDSGTQTAPATSTASGTVTATGPGSGGSPTLAPSTGTLPAPSTACATATAAASACPGGAGASGSPSPQGPVIEPPTSAQLASSSTQPTVVSNIRLVLIAVLIIGATGAIAGTALRADWRPRRRTRRRT